MNPESNSDLYDFSELQDAKYSDNDEDILLKGPPSFSAEELKQLERQPGMTPLLKKVLNNEALPRELIGTSQKHLDALYAKGYKLYTAGKYLEASQIFGYLVAQDYKELKYLFCLAASLHLLKHYQNATNAYAAYATLDPNNPIPFYHMSDCQLKTNDLVGAAVAMEMAVKRAGNNPIYQVLKDRGILAIESIKKEMVKRGMRMPEESPAEKTSLNEASSRDTIE